MAKAKKLPTSHYNRSQHIYNAGEKVIKTRMSEFVPHVGAGSIGVVVTQRNQSVLISYEDDKYKNTSDGRTLRSKDVSKKKSTVVWIPCSAVDGEPMFIRSVDFINRRPGDFIYVTASDKRGLHRSKFGDLQEQYIKATYWLPDVHPEITQDVIEASDRFIEVYDKNLQAIRELQDLITIKLNGFETKLDKAIEKISTI